MSSIPSLQNLCAEELKWSDLAFLNEEGADKALTICTSIIKGNDHFWMRVADRAKPEHIPAIRASIVDFKHGYKNYELSIGKSILQRAVSSEDVELLEKILPGIPDDEIETIAESCMHQTMDPIRLKLINGIRDKKRIRQLLLSKKIENRSFTTIITKHFPELFTEKEISFIENNRMGIFGAEVICYRLRHPLHDGWTKRILMKSKQVPQEDGQLFLNQLLELPSSRRRSQMASYVYAASECEHESLTNRAFYIEPSKSGGVELSIPSDINDKLWEASRSKNVKFLKTFFANFGATIGNDHGIKSWYTVLRKKQP